MHMLYCHCGQLVFYDNTLCLQCGRSLGFDPLTNTMHSLESLGEGRYSDGNGGVFRLCDNREQYGVCNGLVPERNGETVGCCASCSLNRAIPSLKHAGNIPLWSRLERAKHRLISGLTSLGLDLYAPTSRGREQIGFKFQADKRSHPDALETFVSTGHKDGVITVNLLEADDVQRVTQQQLMGERYRTVLGHLRHEVGHFYYQRLTEQLIGQPQTERGEEFKRLFGDPLQDYPDALSRYYQQGPPQDWEQHWISAYASSHPLEDWAECFAHFLHMSDALETAQSLGMIPTTEGMTAEQRLETWGELSVKINEINRSLGVRDAYPFSISAAVGAKLEYIDRCIADA